MPVPKVNLTNAVVMIKSKAKILKVNGNGEDVPMISIMDRNSQEDLSIRSRIQQIRKE